MAAPRPWPVDPHGRRVANAPGAAGHRGPPCECAPAALPRQCPDSLAATPPMPARCTRGAPLRPNYERGGGGGVWVEPQQGKEGKTLADARLPTRRACPVAGRAHAMWGVARHTLPSSSRPRTTPGRQICWARSSGGGERRGCSPRPARPLPAVATPRRPAPQLLSARRKSRRPVPHRHPPGMTRWPTGPRALPPRGPLLVRPVTSADTPRRWR